MSLYRALGLVLHASLMSSHRPPTSTTGQDGRLSSQSRGASRPSSRDTINRPPTRSGRGGSRPGTQDSAARAGQLHYHLVVGACSSRRSVTGCQKHPYGLVQCYITMYIQCSDALYACRVHVEKAVTDLVHACVMYSSRRRRVTTSENDGG